MNMRELAEKNKDYIIGQRRYFHAHPELPQKEVETTRQIAARLRELGLEPETFEGINGCAATLRGERPGKTVLLRGDIDALPVTEKTGLPFASQNEGVMHACGHDCHIAMLLGAAKLLCEMRQEICGSVKFFFQPAEELAQGAKAAVEQGLLEGVDAVFGMHIWGQVDAPKLSIQGGERMASCDGFTLTVTGEASHGSAPHLGRDAIVAASAVIMGLQALVSRVNNPLNALVLSIGTFKGGRRFNIVADRVEMDGTVRTFSPEFRGKIEERIRKTAQSIAEAYGCKAELRYDYMTGPILNTHQDLVEIARSAAVKLYGEDILVDLDKMTGSEDFSFLMDKVPGLYAFIGGRSKDVPGSEKSNHHECYTVDEDALHRGAAAAAQFALDYLSGA